MTGSKLQNKFRMTTRSTRVIDWVWVIRSLNLSRGTFTKLSRGDEYVNSSPSTARSTAKRGGRLKFASFTTVLQSVTVTWEAVHNLRNAAYSFTLFVSNVRMHASIIRFKHRKNCFSFDFL